MSLHWAFYVRYDEGWIDSRKVPGSGSHMIFIFANAIFPIAVCLCAVSCFLFGDFFFVLSTSEAVFGGKCFTVLLLSS